MEQTPRSRADEAKILRTPIRNLLNQNQFKDAMKLVRRVRPDYADDPWLATMQAYLHLVIGEPEQALAMADEAARLGSMDPTVKLVIGAAHRNLGHHVEACETLFVAQKLFPKRADLASMLLEEMAVVHGLERARPLYIEISATISDHELTTTWAKLLFREGLDAELPADLAPAPVMSVPDWMARTGSTMEFVGVREAIPIEDPIVDGGPPAPFKAILPGYVPYACTLRDATIFYRSNIVLMADGVALNDTVADPEYGRFIAFDQDGAAVDQANGRVLLEVGSFQVEEFDAGIMLSGAASQHYGHWVGEYLSRLHYLERHPRFAELPIIVDSDMPVQHLEYLRRMVPNRFVEIPAGGALRCRELIVAGQTTYIPVDLIRNHEVPQERQGGFSVDCIRFIRDRVLSSMPAPESREGKLYLSRKDRGGRRPLNEDQIIAYLTREGFEIVFTENMSFEDQVRTFQAAKVIVAPNGSAVLNTIFAPIDTPLFILSQRNLFNWNTFNGLMRALGHDITFVCGEDETEFKHSNYSIPIERLKGFLESSARHVQAPPDAPVVKPEAERQRPGMEQPSDADALREPIANLVNEGRLVDARELCATSRDAFPLDPWLATMQAYVFLLLADSQKASQVAAEALALGSEDPLASLVLGVAHRNRGRHEEAAEALLTASRLWPDRLDAATMVIEETAAAHGFERAGDVYREVFGRLPDHGLSVLLARMRFDAGLDTDMPAAIVSAPVMSVPAWLARTETAPEFLGVRETIRLEEPPVFGEPNADRFKASVPGYTPYACTLRGATVFSKSSIVLTEDGCALNDMIADERFGQYLVLRHDEIVLRWDEERLLLDVGRYQVEEIEAGVMLSGWASQHFGHWFPEYLGRLPYLERHPRFAELPIIVDSDMPPQLLEYLRVLVTNPIVQIPADGALRCGELIVASPPTFFPINLVEDHQVPPENQGGLPTENFRFLRERVLERLAPARPRDRKIYLSRRDREWRRLLNEEEIGAALAAEGFEILLPEELSFEDQVRMYQSATVVVAPNGSSLLNAIFAPKDLQLIVLSQRGLFNWATFYGPMRELGYDMTFLCGDEETNWKHGDYRIPLPRLMEALGGRR